MKLSIWAKQQGISYQTAWNWFKNNNLPIPFKQLENGTILVFPEKKQKTFQKEIKKDQISVNFLREELD